MKQNSQYIRTDEHIDRSKMSSRTLNAFFWTFSGSSVQYTLRIITIIILARLLTPEDFGVVSAAYTIVQFSEILALLGVGPAIVQRPQIEERHLRTGFTFSTLFGTFLAGVVWLFSPEIADFYQTDKLTSVLRAIILVFPLSGLTVVAESLLQRELQFRKLAGIEVASYAIGNGIIGISLAFLNFGVWSLVIAYLSQEILKSVALLLMQSHSKKPQFELRAFKELFYFGWGLTIAKVFNYFGRQGDNLVVGGWLGVDALGLYGRAYNLMTMPVTILGTALDKVLFPVMSKVQDEPQRLATAYRRGTALIGLIILPVSVAIYLLAPELIDVLFGTAWIGVVAPFQILAMGMLFRTSYKMSVALARAKGAVYRNAWRQGIYAVLIISGAWVGQHWGLTGVALGVLVALVIHFLLMTQLGLSMLPFSWDQLWSVHVPGIWCAAITGIEVWVVATILRELSLPSILIIITCFTIVMVTMLVIARFIPTHILGKDAIWIIQALLERLPDRIFLFVWLKKEMKQATGSK